MTDALQSTYEGKHVLITGGLGFIGSTLAHALVYYGAHVTLVDSLIPQYGGNLFNIDDIKDRVTVNISDVRDRSSMNYLVRGKDYIFNLAGTLSHIDSMKDPFTDLDINCVAQLSILEACRHNNPGVKILFAGTRGQYGKAKKLPVNEEHLQEPIDVNGINNMAGEWYHILYYRAYGIRACSLRLTNTYGPRHQMKHPRQGIINWFIRQVIDGETIRIFGDGEQVRDCTFVGDVVHAFLLAGASPKADGEIFNLGGQHISLKGFAEKIIAAAGKGACELIPYPAENKKIEIGEYVADYTKIKNTLGWEPAIGLEEGLRQSLAFYSEHKHNYWKKGEVW